VSDLAATSRRLAGLGLRRTTLLVDRRRAVANIDRFAARARSSGVVLRPHFKTHQSAGVAAWFRAAGIDRATVSSVGQAAYFADHGWDDLTLAMPANPREVADYAALAARVRLGLLVDHERTVDALASGLDRPVRVWIDIDPGYGRTGVGWHDGERLVAIARRVTATAQLEYAGLLTHAGQSYAARSANAAAAVFDVVRQRLRSARATLVAAGLPGGRLSAGDTPGFAATVDWSGLDEARPGNFVFYDLMQLVAGICTASDLACAVACPVVGVYPHRREAVVHAGAVHLSRECLAHGGQAEYGRLLALADDGFGNLLPGWSLTGLSQEHGILTAQGEPATAQLAALAPGDLVLVAPVHACLTCEQFGSYRTVEGDELLRFRRA